LPGPAIHGRAFARSEDTLSVFGKPSALTLLRRNPMFDLLIIVVMLGILASLGAGLFFLVRDRGQSERTVISLSIRVVLTVLLLVLLALGFVRRFL
jgi:hypothetical protein